MAMSNRFLRPFPAIGRTMFFWGPTDAGNLFTNPARWFFDAARTMPAGRVPSAEDHVIIQRTMSNAGGTFTVARLTMQTGSLSQRLLVRGDALFTGNSTLGGTNGFVVAGVTTFIDNAVNAGSANLETPIARFFNASANAPSGVIHGLTFWFDAASNSGVLLRDAVFSGGSSNNGEVYANAAFYNTSFNGVFGLIYGNATLYDLSENVGYADSVTDLRQPPEQ